MKQFSLPVDANPQRNVTAWLERIPLIYTVARTRGWPFVMSWCHRLAGLALIVFLWLHIDTLSALLVPARYDAKMGLFRFFLFAFLEWALVIPVIFHALNGGRLILYEGFGARNDVVMIRWMLGLSLAFATVLGVLMIKGNQDVTAGFFWFAATTAGLVIALGVVLRFRGAGHSLGWKLQRISGAFLLVMVPAHLLFMHLNLPMGHEAEVVIARMQSLFVRVVDVLLLGSVLFHGGYGLASVLGDYVGFKPLRWGLAVLVSVGVVLLAWMGIRVILLV